MKFFFFAENKNFSNIFFDNFFFAEQFVLPFFVCAYFLLFKTIFWQTSIFVGAVGAFGGAFSAAEVRKKGGQMRGLELIM